MVYLRKIIENNKYLLNEFNIEVIWYYYLQDRSKLEHIELKNLSEQEIFALSGYKGEKRKSSDIDKLIAKPPIKGIDFTSNIFKFLGIYLLDKRKLYKKLESKFDEVDLKYKFVICKVESKFREKLIKYLNSSDFSNIERIYFVLLKYLLINNNVDISKSLHSLIRKPIDTVDLLILGEIERMYITSSISYLNISALDLTRRILNSFSNAIHKITKDRRKGHDAFSIEDEYDVQDLLYTIFKSIFPEIITEEPTPSVGASHNKVDFIIKSEGILIEVKMLKNSNKDEKNCIEQLKIDIQSYYRQSDLKNLICFIYDPFHKTKDKNNFYDLNATHVINNKEFYIETIIVP